MVVAKINQYVAVIQRCDAIGVAVFHPGTHGIDGEIIHFFAVFRAPFPNNGAVWFNFSDGIRYSSRRVAMDSSR